MRPHQLDEKEIFKIARQIDSPETRAKYLRQIGRDDPELLERVIALLQAFEKQSSFLESPAAAATVHLSEPTEAPGSVIGPYRLLEQIGQGGFGAVYVAEQTEPVRRRVALKIIKPGMDSREVIARFQAERQALALMDHPNIAHVLDAGATDSGRPYFVMELVKGVPITEYCDQSNLTTSERLELFISICQAIQHAHQKGIIHRDIKPSNVLVAIQDGRPVAKVIDFGVAKAIGRRLTDHTLYTGFAQMIGTPLYMSPEQAEMSALDVDTRTDVYSLGVLLYELLTGTTPFERKRLKSASFDELRRIIREEEPPRPSARLSTLAVADLSTISSHRRTDPRRLSQTIRGDLDWIAMKALEKDRTRRYESASELAADIERYLSHEPVEACPPSRMYRFKKFIRRNQQGAILAAVVLVALVIGTVASVMAAARFRVLADRNAALAQEKDQALGEAIDAKKDAEAKKEQAVQARTAAEQARQREEHLRKEADRQRKRAEANFAKAFDVVDEYLTQISQNELLSAPGLQPLRQDLLAAALRFYKDFVKQRSDDPQLRLALADAHYRIGMIHREQMQWDQAREANLRAIAMYQTLRAGAHENPKILVGLANALYFARRYNETIALCQRILNTDAEDAEIKSLLSETYNSLAIRASDRKDYEKALGHHQQALALREGLVRRFPKKAHYVAQLGATINNIGVLLAKQDKHREALDMYRRANEYAAQAHELTPHSILWGRWLATGLGNAARTEQELELDDQALQSWQQQVQVCRKQVFNNPSVGILRSNLVNACVNLARHQSSLGQTEAADRSFRLAKGALQDMPREGADNLFNIASVHGYLAQPPEGAGTESMPQEPTPQEIKDRAHHAKMALETLKKSVEAGFDNAEVLKTSPAFASLRQRPEFKELIPKVDKRGRAKELLASKDLDQRRQGLEILRELGGEDLERKHQLTLAAAAHAIGVLATELKKDEEAEKSLNEALAILQKMFDAEPTDTDLMISAAATRVSLGTVAWEADRVPDALNRWDLAAELLTAAAKADPENVTLQRQIGEQERAIYGKFGQLGLWERVAEYVLRNVTEERTTHNMMDARYAIVLMATGKVDEHRRYGRLLHHHWRGSGPAHSLWAVAMNPDPLLQREDLRALADEVAGLRDHGFYKTVAASGYYRAGEYQKAVDVLQPLDKYENSAQYTAYLLAMIHQKMDKADQARQFFDNAERDFRKKALRCLTDPKRAAAVTSRGYWWELAYAQVMRREAWQVVRGGESPGDPWQHALQSRAWEKLRQPEKAREEFQQALADYEALIQHDAQYADRYRAEMGFLQAIDYWERGEKERAYGAYLRIATWWEKHSKDKENQDLAALHKAAAEVLQGVTESNAIKFFTDAIKAAPSVAVLYEERAAAYARMGEIDEAAADSVKAVELTPDERRHQGMTRPVYQRLVEHDEVFARVTRLRPDDVDLWIERGRYFALRGDWKRAADHYSHVFDVRAPISRYIEARSEYVCLLALLGREDDHRMLCRNLFEQIKDLERYPAFHTGRGLAMAPSPEIDMAHLLEVLRREDKIRKGLDWYEYLVGVGQMRAGLFKQALEQMEQYSAAYPYQHPFLQALIHNAMGETEQARSLYDVGRKKIAPVLTAIPPRRFRGVSEPLGWLWLNVAYREALQAFEPAKYHELAAVSFARGGQFDRAAEHFVEAIKLAPKERRVLNIAQPLYQALTQWEEVFNRVAKLRPDDLELWIERGRYLAWRKQWRRAAEHYAQVIDESSPNIKHGSRSREYGCLLLLIGDDDTYRTLCQQLLEKIPSVGPNSAYDSAWTCALAPNPHLDANRLVEVVERVAKPKTESWHLPVLALVHLRAGRLKEALQYAEQAASQKPGRHGKFLLALARHAQGDAKKGRSAYEVGLEQYERIAQAKADPPETTHRRKNHPHWWLWLNLLHREAMLTFEPQKWYEQRAVTLAAEKRYDEAAAEFVKAIEAADPTSQLFFRHPIYQRLMQWDEVFDRVAQLRPEDQRLWIERGRYFAWGNDWQHALQQYAHVINVNAPKIKHSAWGREYACLLLLAGDHEKYRTLCQRLVQSLANSDEPFKLAWICSLASGMQMDWDRLIEEIERRPPDKELLLWHGLINLRAGRNQQAIGYAEQSERGVLQNHRRFLLALAYHGLGNGEQSRRAYQAGRNMFERLSLLGADPPERRHPSCVVWLGLHLLEREATRTIDPGKYHSDRARDHLKHGRIDEAAAEFAELVDALPKANPQLGAPLITSRELFENEDLFHRVADLRPERRELWTERGRYYVLQSDWRRAAEHYARVLEPDLPKIRTGSYSCAVLFEYAALRLLLHDQDGYRRVCRKMAEYFANGPSDAQRSWLIRAAANPASGIDPSQLTALAQRIIAQEETPWYLSALGLAQYRSGQYQEAVKSFEKSSADWSAGAAFNSYYLAAAHQRDGNLDMARRWYVTAKSELDRRRPLVGGTTAPRLWLWLNIARPEAMRTIEPENYYGPRAARFVRQKRYEEAAQEIIQALERAPAKNPKHWAPWDVYQALIDKLENGDEVFERVAALRPDDVNLWIERGRNEALRKRWKPAAKYYGRVFETGSLPVTHPCAEYALLLLLDGNHAGYQRMCRRMTDQVATSDSGAKSWWNVMVLACATTAESGIDVARILKSAERLHNSNPNWPHYTLSLGLARLRAGQHQRAVEHLKRSSEQIKRGDWGPTNFPLALAHHRLGNSDESRRRYAVGIRWLESQRPATTRIPLLYWLLGNILYDEAMREIEPAKYYGLRAAEYVAQEQFDEAAGEVVKALEHLPAKNSNTEAKWEIYQALIDKLANRDEVFQRVAILRPDNVNLWIERARYEALRRRWKQAAEHYARVIEEGAPRLAAHSEEYALAALLDSNHAVYQRQCRRMTDQLGASNSTTELARAVATCTASAHSGIEAARVLQWAERAQAQKDWHKNSYFVGLAALRAGQFQRAVDQLERAIKQTKQPQWPIAHFPLALAHHEMGNRDEAQKRYEMGVRWLQKIKPSDANRPVKVLYPAIWLAAEVFYREAMRLFEPEKYFGLRAAKFATQEQFDEAAREVVQALEAVSAEAAMNWSTIPVYQSLIEKLDDRDEIFTRVSALRPDDTRLWVERARYHALQSRWSRAAAHYGNAIGTRLSPELLSTCGIEYAGSLLLSGDQEGYRRLCEIMTEQFRKHRPIMLNRQFICTLAASADSGVDPVQILQWAEDYVARKEKRQGLDIWSLNAAGAASYRAGRFAEAIERLEKSHTFYMKKRPRGGSWAPNDFLLALAHHRQGRAEESRKYYVNGDKRHRWEDQTVGPAEYWIWNCLLRREAMRQFEPEKYHRLQAVEHAQAGRFEEAAEEVVALLKHSPQVNPQSWRQWPLYQELFAKLDNRDEIFSRVAKLQPGNKDLWIERGRYFALRGDWRRAAEHYEHVINDIRPAHQNPTREYACLLLLTGQQKKYQRGRRTLLEPFPPKDDPRAFGDAWTCLLLPSDDVDYARLVELMKGAEPHVGRPYYFLALAAGNLWAGRHDEAIRNARQAMNIPGESLAAAFVLAMAHQQSGHPREARGWYDTGRLALRTKAPKAVVLFRLWANVLFRQAAREFEPAKYHQLQGLTHSKAGCFNEAAAEFIEILKIEPDTDELIKLTGRYTENWARILLLGGNEAAYRQLCRRLLTHYGKVNDPIKVDRLVQCFNCADWPTAELEPVLEMAQGAVQRDPKSAKGLVRLGASLYRAGRYQQALRWIDQAAELRQGQTTVWSTFWLAMIHHRLGQGEEASRFLKQAVKDMDDQVPGLILLRREAEQLLGQSRGEKAPNSEQHKPASNDEQ